MANKTHDFHVRITEEMYQFLDDRNVNKSELVRDAITNLMQEEPKRLRERKAELEQELEKIDEKLTKLAKKKEEKMGYLDVIAEEFQRFGRPDKGDHLNIEWIKARYSQKLAKRNIHMTPEEVLRYCKNERKK